MTELSSVAQPLGETASVTSRSNLARAGNRLSRRLNVMVLIVGSIALSAFAFGWVWRVGHRGLFMLDESIVFDGAWRVQQGQVPYRDFVMPFGPVTFWLQAAMFRCFGVDFSTMVLTAALLSVLATLFATRLIWRLTSGSVSWSMLGGLLTAVWYQAPFGVPWLEQTAFFFDLLALLLIVEGRFVKRGAACYFALAGVASALSVLSKQNAGGLFVGVCLGCLCLPFSRALGRALRAVVAYSAGGLLAALVFLAWLVLRSSPQAFFHYWFSISAGVGWARVAYWKILGTLTFQPLLGSSIVLFIVSSLVGSAALVRAHARVGTLPGADLRLPIAGWLCLALPQFHSFFQLTTNNDAPNNNAFVGVCAALAGFLLAECLGGVLGLHFRGEKGTFELALPRRALPCTLLLMVSVALYSVGEGMIIAWTRNVQEFEGASFDEPLLVPRARGLLWGEPTRITPQFCGGLGEMCKLSAADADRERPLQILRKADFEGIALELQRRQQNFFVFPDATILYGLLGRPSPQPLLYFHPGQSYSPRDQSELDHRILQSLQDNQVELLVIERASFMGTHKLLTAFPALNAWFEHDFRSVMEIGNYRLFERVRR